MIGPRATTFVTPRVGPWAGMTRGAAEEVAWTVDAASGRAFPADDTEEAAFVAASPSAGPAATLIYTCQEASGNLTEAGGGPALTASGAPTYQEAVAGYTRTALGIPDGAANTGFSTNDASLPDPSASRYLMLVVAKSLGAPAAGRGMMHVSLDNQIRTTTTPRMRMLLAGDDRNVAMDMDGDVHWYFAAVDEVANTAYAGWEDVLTDAVHTTPASVNKMVAIGGFDATSFAMQVLAIYVWHTTIPTKAELKARLQAHGLTVAWSP